ncbi:MAG: dienelactone hydrolase family protein [Spirulina sp. SIO3F2]|nr:dienelactone hydrolase family protein [Spirulina sp. SIO3F2]
MTALPVQTQSLSLTNGDLTIAAYLAQPQASGIYPGIVVIQEVFGINSHIRNITERLAQAGYVAIAPAIYQRTAPGFEVGYSPEDLAEGRKHKEQTTAPQLLNDIQCAIAYLQSLSQVKLGGVGTIGFCFGGHVAYLAATLPTVRATASFYGAGIAIMTPGGDEPTLMRTAEIQGTIYCFFGNADPLIPVEQVETITTALQTHQIDHQIFRYDNVGHGFVCDQRSDYDETAANHAWQQALQLFKAKL